MHYVHLCLTMCACVYTCACVCMYACMCVCVCACVCVCMCVCVHVWYPLVLQLGRLLPHLPPDSYLYSWKQMLRVGEVPGWKFRYPLLSGLLVLSQEHWLLPVLVHWVDMITGFALVFAYACVIFNWLGMTVATVHSICHKYSALNSLHLKLEKTYIDAWGLQGQYNTHTARARTHTHTHTCTHTHTHARTHMHTTLYEVVQNGIIFHNISVSTWQQKLFPDKDEHQQNPPNKLVHPLTGLTCRPSITSLLPHLVLCYSLHCKQNIFV